MANRRTTRRLRTIAPTCHVTTDWADVSFDHAGITGDCVSCHNNTDVDGKPADHLPTSDVCETCHVTTDWATVQMDHTQTSATCITCHNNTDVDGKTR